MITCNLRTMIDIHSHFFRDPEHFSRDFVAQALRARNGVHVDLTVRWPEYEASSAGCRWTIVFGGKAKLSGLWVPDSEVAEYVAAQPNRLLGFLSVDPTQAGWREELIEGHQNLKMKGIKLLPMYAGFSPDVPELAYLWQYASRNGLPVLLHTGTTFIDKAPLAYARPYLLDGVATRYPDVKIIMAHLSHPYEGECAVVIRKHANVYADCSALHYRPFQLYHSLMLVQEYGVWNKVLFGTDYPFTTVEASISGIRKLNEMLEGTKLPRLSEERIEEMIHRDALAVLGIEP
ncbi:MAG: amidohydrolase family protein [Bryobacteraceae bacterium]